MEAINRFRELFLEVWKEGVFGLNASEIFSVANVNGALVGGASLSFDTFSPIVQAIENKT